MNKIKTIAKVYLGFQRSLPTSFPELDEEVNKFLNTSNIEILDLQYKIDTSGGILVASVMVYYKEQ